MIIYLFLMDALTKHFLKPTKYVGWIKANRKDRYALSTLGCEGPMLFHADGNEPITKTWIPNIDRERLDLELGVMEPASVGPTIKEVYGYEGHFSHCEFKTLDMIKHAKERWPHFYAGAFTAVDERGEPLSRCLQHAWRIK